MVADVKRYECDACKKVDCTDIDKALDNWHLNTEVGDLCPTCARSWESYKKSFIDKMRLDSGAELSKT